MEVSPSKTLWLRQDIIPEAVTQRARASPFLIFMLAEERFARRCILTRTLYFFRIFLKAMDCALTKRRRCCISFPHLSTSRSSLMNLRCLLRVIRSWSSSLHRAMSRWTWLDRCSARVSQAGHSAETRDGRISTGVRVSVCGRGCIRSRRVISSALAETKRPALSCWAHSSL